MPAAVGVYGRSFFPFESHFPVGLVKHPRAALALEIIDDIRQSAPLEDVFLDKEVMRPDRLLRRRALYEIGAFLVQRGKIDRPKMPVLPLPDRPDRNGSPGKGHLPRAH